jgi:hypothetical protein
MAFEERVDVHSELLMWELQPCKTLKIKVSTKDEAWKYTYNAKKNDFTVFSKKKDINWI